MKAPCHGCEKRTPGCHDSCPEYQEYKSWCQRKNAMERDAKSSARSHAFYKEMNIKLYYCNWWR